MKIWNPERYHHRFQTWGIIKTSERYQKLEFQTLKDTTSTPTILPYKNPPPPARTWQNGGKIIYIYIYVYIWQNGGKIIYIYMIRSSALWDIGDTPPGLLSFKIYWHLPPAHVWTPAFELQTKNAMEIICWFQKSNIGDLQLRNWKKRRQQD